MKSFLLLLLFPITTFGQNTIGLPNIINYNKSNYKAGLQNWEIRQSKNGQILVANNEGLLTFDGKYWKTYPLPNKTIVRSLEIGEDDKIYVGGQDEIGYFYPNSYGVLIYHSLLDKLKEADRSFADVWDIVKLNNIILFRTNYKIFKLENESFTLFDAPKEWTYLGKSNNEVFAKDLQNGLFTYKSNIWEKVNINEIDDKEITSVLKFDNLMVSTLRDGIFSANKNKLVNIGLQGKVFNTQETIFSTLNINNEWIAIGTASEGMVIINKAGDPIQRFSKSEGLQNNTVHCLFLDNQKNLWLGLDNGITCIAFNSAIKLINPNQNGSSAYTAAVFQNKLYLGTSQGLFYTPLEQKDDLSFSKGNFKIVNNARGQAWNLTEINNKLLLASHYGALEIKENNAITISGKNGFWNFSPIDNIAPSSLIIGGNYNGLRYINYNNEKFTEGEIIPNFGETSRFVVVDKLKNYWVSHPYHGVYKVSLKNNGAYEIKLFSKKEGLSSTNNNHIYKCKGEIAIATEAGIYTYDYEKEKFKTFEYFDKAIGKIPVRYLKEDNDGNIWFVTDKKIGVLYEENNATKIKYLPELNKKLLNGFEAVYSLNKNNVFVSGDEGLYHINFEKYKSNKTNLKVNITSVTITNKIDSLLFGGFNTEYNIPNPEINNDWKSFKFDFATPSFGNENLYEYSFRLVGFDNNWSEWNIVNEKEYTNLPAKNYTFEVKVRDNINSESSIATYKFTVLPPWYKSTLAYIFYFIILGYISYLLYNHQQKKFKFQQIKNDEEQKKQQYLHQLEMEKTETELINLRNEKLNTEIEFKNAELASTAMHLLQKGELITKLKSDLIQITKNLEEEKAVQEIKKVIKVIGEDDKMDNDWENFAQHFDSVHSKFISILKEHHPNISPNETKLSAYLHMNLSTKEIAQLMNISVRGIEISRYRLRKKLNLSTEVSLFEYLTNLKKKEN